MFRGEVFVIDLKEGDLGDSWNSIKLKTGEIFDFNFGWQRSIEPAVTLYAVDSVHLTTDFSDWTTIKIKEIIGTQSDYFNLSFDSSLPLKFELLKDNKVIYKAKSLTKLANEKVKRELLYKQPLQKRVIDSNGASKYL